MTTAENDAFCSRIEELAAHLPGASGAAIAQAAGPLAEFLTLLREENKTTNLVSKQAAAPEELVNRHLADSLFGLAFLPEPSPRAPLRLLDIGSGGGFPAIPLLVVRRDLGATLVESTRKKCVFLEIACRRLALTAEVVNARFPDSFSMNDRPSSPRYDVLTTRAVASSGRLVRAARTVLAPTARALLWTTENLFTQIRRESDARDATFHLTPGTEKAGIAVLSLGP